MAEKFDPAPHDKHAADPREALLADREIHEKLESRPGRYLSGLRSRERGATGAVEDDGDRENESLWDKIAASSANIVGGSGDEDRIQPRRQRLAAQRQ